MSGRPNGEAATMNPHAARAAELETAFLTGVEANLNAAKGARLRGTRWRWQTRDQNDRVRDLLAARGEYDRELLRILPRNGARILTGQVPRWLIGYKRSCVAVAATLSPLEHYVKSDEPVPPAGLTELSACVRQLVGEADVPHVVGVCSPSGFTEEVRRGGLDLPNIALVLVEPREEGGWRVTPASPRATAADARLFDPEATASKIQRVREEIARRSVDLLTGGLSAAAIAEHMGLSRQVVASAFEQCAANDPELRVGRQRDDVLLYRGASASLETSDMSMVNWLRQLFSREGNETRKINALSERRALLAQRRERLYNDIAQLETREGDLLKQGKESPSPVVKRRVATQIKQVRDDIERLTAVARVMGQQVDVVNTHIHNLTLIQQGKLAKLPSSEEITQDAVRAEEMLEQLGSDVQLTETLSVGVGVGAASDDELAILKELEGPADTGAAPPSKIAASQSPSREVAGEEKRPAKPEPG